MNKKLLVSCCAFLLTASLAAAQGSPVSIQEVTDSLSGPTKNGTRTLTMSYPQIQNGENEFAGQKMSLYFSHNADKYKHQFQHGEDRNIAVTEGLSYKVVLNDGTYLSVLEKAYTYYKGAAHPMSGTIGATFDARTGKKLIWQDLVRPEDESAFTLEAINAKIFASEYGRDGLLFRDFKGLKKLPRNYYLDGQQYIHFLFGQYEIAPYSSGIIDINMEKRAK